jgi:hypothetical protein
MARNGTGVETKVAAGSSVAVLSGVVVWALTTFIPAWRAGIPVQLQPFIPMAVSAFLGTLAAYRAPHTHRPDLVDPVAHRGHASTRAEPHSTAQCRNPQAGESRGPGLGLRCRGHTPAWSETARRLAC